MKSVCHQSTYNKKSINSGYDFNYIIWLYAIIIVRRLVMKESVLTEVRNEYKRIKKEN